MKGTWWTIVSNHFIAKTVINCPKSFHLKEKQNKTFYEIPVYI